MLRASPNFSSELPPVNQLVSASIIPPPVKVNMASARYLIPSAESESSPLIAFKKGFKFSPKAERFSPTLGNESVTPSRSPPTILPANLPTPSPNFSRIGSPLSINFSSSGNCSIRYPIAPTNAPTASINTANAAIPGIAKPASIPATLHNINATVMAVMNTLRAIALDIAFSQPKALIIANTRPPNAATITITANAAIAVQLTVSTILVINNAVAIAFMKIPKPIAF